MTQGGGLVVSGPKGVGPYSDWSGGIPRGLNPISKISNAILLKESGILYSLDGVRVQMVWGIGPTLWTPGRPQEDGLGRAGLPCGLVCGLTGANGDWSTGRGDIRFAGGPKAQDGVELHSPVEDGGSLEAAERVVGRGVQPEGTLFLGNVEEGMEGSADRTTEGVGRRKGGDCGTRTSSRLVATEAPSMLEKAIARKARREALGGGGGKRSLLLNRKKIKNKGVLCGVLLNEGGANSLHEFVSRKE